MTQPAADVGELPAATECGRICAVAGQGQRQMQEWAATYGDLFSAKAFDPALFSTLALAAAFSGPWLTGDQLRMANRVCLWCFGVDWLIDYIATSRSEVCDIVQRCLAVADGGAPVEGDDLTRFLADIRDELASAPAFTMLRPVWRDELQRMLQAMAREWDWKTAHAADTRTRPTFEDYLGNADNLGFSFVFASHWIFTSDPPPPADITEVRAASWAVQRVIRLLNDLGTYQRDLSWGDLNALMLGITSEEVNQHVTVLAEQCRELIRPMRASQAQLAGYLERQMQFCAGFYRITDYWGDL